MTKLVSRADWNAQPAKGDFRKMERCDGVVLHHTGSDFTYDNHDQCVMHVAAIQNAHLHHPTEDYLDIAYNLLTCEHDYMFIGRGKNVCGGANGTTDSNRRYYSVCLLIPNTGPVPDRLKTATLHAIAYLKAGSVPVGAKRLGHKDIVPTACPGDNVYAWLHAGLPAPPGPVPPPKPPAKPDIPMVAVKPAGVAPGKEHAQVKELDKALTRIGFKVAVPSTYYGETTSNAVARFHNAYPQFRGAGKSYDPAIGPKGWAKIRDLAY